LPETCLNSNNVLQFQVFLQALFFLLQVTVLFFWLFLISSGPAYVTFPKTEKKKDRLDHFRRSTKIAIWYAYRRNWKAY